MKLADFLNTLTKTPESIEFNDTIAVIESLYELTPTRFTNGDLINEAGENSGSCKLFAFAKLQDLTEAQTLACFGAYYRDDVLKNPDNNDHQNIRNFMQTGWAGVHFNEDVLTLKV